jgi:DNA-binding response OmpR family regulator
VLLLTARTLESQEIEGYEHGADAYIAKPFTSRLLLAASKIC